MASERLRAVWDLLVPYVREYGGLHEYDGKVQDLSPTGVAAAIRRLGGPGEELNKHDDAHLGAVEAGLRTTFGVTEHHRWNPMVHLANLDLACYDRLYAPAAERDAARLEHLAGWPSAIEGALESLDRIPAPIASCLIGVTGGLAAGLDALEAEAEVHAAGSGAIVARAREAHAALVAHVERATTEGTSDVSLGSAALASLLGEAEAMTVDLGRLEELADAERDRLVEHLEEACNKYRPGADPRELVPELTADHPEPEGIYEAASVLVDEATKFVLEHNLLPDVGGTCLVGPAPPSRRYAMAMMSWPAPAEVDAPACFYVTPPEPTWDEQRREEWLSVFSATTLPSITVHEVMPGHFAHGRMLGRAEGEVRRTLFSPAFVEGWAHYAEELMLDEGFLADDPRFAIGVWVEALVRVTRLASALGVHGGTMTVDEASRRFEEDALLAPAAARSEAERAMYDPTYGRYTWGKLEILKLRDEAMVRWGRRYTHRRFHDALLALAAPPLGTMGDALGD